MMTVLDMSQVCPKGEGRGMEGGREREGREREKKTGKKKEKKRCRPQMAL